jgi:hypothetical protein
MKSYPLTNDDLAESVRRSARGELCTIPLRRDIEMTDGLLAQNCLTWGSSECYQVSLVELPGGDIYIGEARK